MHEKVWSSGSTQVDHDRPVPPKWVLEGDYSRMLLGLLVLWQSPRWGPKVTFGVDESRPTCQEDTTCTPTACGARVDVHVYVCTYM